VLTDLAGALEWMYPPPPARAMTGDDAMKLPANRRPNSNSFFICSP
jgi:hypothetical protein